MNEDNFELDETAARFYQNHRIGHYLAILSDVFDEDYELMIRELRLFIMLEEDELQEELGMSDEELAGLC